MRPSLQSGAVVGLLVMAAGLGGCTGSRTYGTGEAPEMAILNEVTGGLGIGGKKKEPIDYQPRAPLVLPPSNQLRSPVQTAEAADPQWPVDPDKRRSRSEGDEELTREELQELKKYAYLNENRRQAEAGMRRDREPGALELREQNRKFQAALAAREGNSATERRYLTEPPLDYRAPAPTAPTEFDEIDPKKKKGFFSRLFSG